MYCVLYFTVFSLKMIDTSNDTLFSNVKKYFIKKVVEK